MYQIIRVKEITIIRIKNIIEGKDFGSNNPDINFFAHSLESGRYWPCTSSINNELFSRNVFIC